MQESTPVIAKWNLRIDSASLRFLVGLAWSHLLLGGALTGVRLLFQVIDQRTFHVISRAIVEAHANSQLYGWAGLTIVVLSYSVLPVVKDQPFSRRNNRSLVTACLIVGTVLHPVFHALQELGSPSPGMQNLFLQASMTASFIQLAGWGFFLLDLFRFIRAIPEEKQHRFEKCVLLGGVWFWAGLLLTVLTRVLHAVQFTRFSLHPNSLFAIRNVQLTGGTLLMLLGFIQPLYRRFPHPPAWRQPTLSRITFWSLPFSVFLFSISFPVMMANITDGVRWTLARMGVVASGVLLVLGIAEYLLSLRRVWYLVRKAYFRTSYPFPGWRTWSYRWLAVSVCILAWVAIWSAAHPGNVGTGLLFVQVHIYALGFLVPALAGVLCDYGLLRIRSGRRLWGLCFRGLQGGLLVGFLPLLTFGVRPNWLNHVLPLVGGGVAAIAVAGISLVGLLNLRNAKAE